MILAKGIPQAKRYTTSKHTTSRHDKRKREKDRKRRQPHDQAKPNQINHSNPTKRNPDLCKPVK